MTTPSRLRRSFVISVMAGVAILVAAGLVSAPPDAAPRRYRNVQFGVETRLGGEAGTNQTEPSIAVDPADPNVLAAGYIDYPDNPRPGHVRSVSSADGGVVWTPSAQVPQARPRTSTGDPSLAVDSAGTVYQAYLEYGASGQTAGELEVLVATSTDGGRTFPAFTVAGPHGGTASNDKPFMTVDAQPRSSFNGTAYVAWMNFLAGVTVAVSRDGARTWSAPALVAPFEGTTFAQSPVPIVAPDGTAYIFYAQYQEFTEPRVTSIRHVRSTDGGSTWSAPADVAANLPSPGEFLLRNADPRFGVELGRGVRAYSFPSVAITPGGDIFVVWADFPEGSCTFLGGSPSPCTNADLRLSMSRDGAKTWSAPVKVSDNVGPGDEFLPWIAAHPDGLVSIIWLDRRLDPENVDYDLFYTNTYDGRTFLPNVRVTRQPSLLGDRSWVGEYVGLAAAADGVFPVWTDLRAGTPAIFFARGLLAP